MKETKMLCHSDSIFKTVWWVQKGYLIINDQQNRPGLVQHMGSYKLWAIGYSQ